MSELAGRRPDDAPETVAFYLPQFHAIPENDRWWGKGFTEWTNVRRARPLFPGHYQPQVAGPPLGEYDLLSPQVLNTQVELAKKYDVNAFAYYHYWFDGKRLLERPLDVFLGTDIDHKFAICWANENWTRRWDGKEREVLMGQRYDEDTAEQVFRSFLPYLRDERYLRTSEALVLIVHRADHLPNAQKFAETWRRLARAAGLGELWLVASETHDRTPKELGFDAVVEFPPVGDSDLGTALSRLPAGTARGFSGRMCSYPALARRYMEREDVPFVRHPTVVPRWDNTTRRRNNATIYVGSTPQLYAEWLKYARDVERDRRGAEGLVFINAWNEWAEGAYLEPDGRWGLAYLEASRWGARLDPVAPHDGAQRAGRLNVGGVLRAAARSGLTRAQAARRKSL